MRLLSPLRYVACAWALALCGSHGAAAGESAASIRIVGDSIPKPLAGPGDVERGRALLVSRESANCVLCHAIPDPAFPFAGDVGPSLAQVATRLSPAQMRLRIVDNMRLNPDTIMPSYYRTSGLDRVARSYLGKTILTAQQVEDLVAYLGTLR